MWGFSSVGRASVLHAEGQEFEPLNLHQHAPVVQMGEHRTFNARVEVSSTSMRTNKKEIADVKGI